MASEYLKYLARNEKPREEYVMTPEEKRANWWHYNKVKVIVGILAVLIAVWMITDIVGSKRNAPDYQVAYVGSMMLPEATVTALQDALASFGQDLTGDGEVTVLVKQFIDGDDQVNAQRMLVDIASGESTIFLMEDPEGFQQSFEVLAYRDGVYVSDEQRREPYYYRWTDLPALTALELGNYLDGAEDISPEDYALGDNQAVLADFYIARRGAMGDSRLEADQDMWNRILTGMQ